MRIFYGERHRPLHDGPLMDVSSNDVVRQIRSSIQRFHVGIVVQ